MRQHHTTLFFTWLFLKLAILMLRALHKVHSEKHKGCFAMNTEKENYYFLRKVSTRRIINTRHSVACIVGVSARVCRESWQESKKKKE